MTLAGGFRPARGFSVMQQMADVRSIATACMTACMTSQTPVYTPSACSKRSLLYMQAVQDNKSVAQTLHFDHDYRSSPLRTPRNMRTLATTVNPCKCAWHLLWLLVRGLRACGLGFKIWQCCARQAGLLDLGLRVRWNEFLCCRGGKDAVFDSFANALKTLGLGVWF